MNLAKKGTVLLTALSVFALASCGAKEVKLDYNAAKEWVTKNYTSTEEKKVKQTKVHWDYSKTVGEDDATTKAARELVVNALKGYFKDAIKDDDYAKLTFDTTLDGAHALSGDSLEPLNGENFDEAFEDDKDSLEFASKGKLFIVAGSSEEEVEPYTIDRNDKQTYDESGYLQTWETTFDKKDIDVGGKKVTIHLEDKLTPIC